MANHIEIALEISSAEILSTDAYGSGALLRVESASTEAGTYGEIASTVVVSGTEAYDFWDPAGSGSTWYKHRVTNSAGTRSSAYSSPFQVDTNQYTTLDVVKERLGLTTTTDDARLGRLLGAACRFMTNRITAFIGPSSDTSRIYDGYDAWDGQLWIPGGIRTLTAATMADGTGETQTSVTLADILLRPKRHRLVPGAPYTYLQFSDNPTGDWSDWAAGYDNITLTGTFGWAEVPEDLAELCAKLTARMWLSRASGQTDQFGTDALGHAVISRFVARTDYQMLDWYRDRTRARAA